MTKHIIIIDDYELFRKGLGKLIESNEKYTVTAEFSLSDLLKGKIGKENIDLIILDPFVEGFSLKEVFKQLTSDFADVPLMVFTNTVNKRAILESIEYGISAYFTKSITSIQLNELISDLTLNERKSDIRLEQGVKNALSSNLDLYIQFTPAEEEVLKLVCQQKSSVDISKQLGISARTVESRKRNMMQKTKSKNMIGVIVYGIKNKVVQDIFGEH